jgi:hypothetical protein
MGLFLRRLSFRRNSSLFDKLHAEAHGHVANQMMAQVTVKSLEAFRKGLKETGYVLHV